MPKGLLAEPLSNRISDLSINLNIAGFSIKINKGDLCATNLWIMNLLNVFIIYITSCKILPFVIYPNYLFKSKIESYPELKKTALGFSNGGKMQAIQSAYNYMTDKYSGHGFSLHLKTLTKVLGSLFYIGDFSTENILNKKQFLWCHCQNRILKSLLVNTGLFNESDIKIEKRFFSSFFIHQWVIVSLDEQIIKIDPYYEIFEIK